MLRKFDTNISQICPPHLRDVATLPWEFQKVIFNSIIHTYFTSDYLLYLRRKQTVTQLPTTLEMSPHQLVKCKNFFI